MEEQSIYLTPPSPFKSYGGSDISATFGAGGWIYWSCNVEWGSKRPDEWGQAVFRTHRSTGAVEPVIDPRIVRISGRGQLAVGDDLDELWVVAWDSYDAHPSPARLVRVPGYQTPASGSTGVVTGPPSDVAAVLARLELLESKVAGLQGLVAQLQSKLASVEAVANKANERGLNALTQLVPVKDTLATRIGRDDAWQIAADRCYVEVTTEGTGVRSAIEALVQPASGAIDAEARQLAQDAKNLAMSAQDTLETLPQAIQAGIDAWWERSVTYVDRRLLNLLWDRAVKLLRYKERTGKTAEQLPINDPKNLEV